MKTIPKYLAMVLSLKYLFPEYNYILLNNKRINSVRMKEIYSTIPEEDILKQENKMQRKLSDDKRRIRFETKALKIAQTMKSRENARYMTSACLCFWVQLLSRRLVKLLSEVSSYLFSVLKFCFLT